MLREQMSIVLMQDKVARGLAMAAYERLHPETRAASRRTLLQLDVNTAAAILAGLSPEEAIMTWHEIQHADRSRSGAIFQELTKRYPGTPATLSLLKPARAADSLAAHSDPEDAAVFWADIQAADPDGASALLTEMLRRYPTSPITRIFLGAPEQR